MLNCEMYTAYLSAGASILQRQWSKVPSNPVPSLHPILPPASPPYSHGSVPCGPLDLDAI